MWSRPLFSLLSLLVLATPAWAQHIANHCGEVPFGAPQPTVLVPGPGWAKVSGAVVEASIKGGHHYYRVMATEGCTITFSFCGHGGSCNYDSGLSIWNGDLTEQLGCNMNGCGLGSELTWTAPADGLYHLRIGGMEDGSIIKSYTLAYGLGDNACSPTGVDASTWSLLKCRFRE